MRIILILDLVVTPLMIVNSPAYSSGVGVLAMSLTLDVETLS